jgi:hypothetical protein
MPYGFNDDKSQFDLENMGGAAGTFTPNISASNGVSTADISVWKEGRIACIAGTFKPAFGSQSLPFWLTVGTIEDYKPAATAGGVAIDIDDVMSMPVTIDASGVVRVQINYASLKGQTHAISMLYVVGEGA